ncbi:hypothetical protein FQZ97_769140 [compost metagenome]
MQLPKLDDERLDGLLHAKLGGLVTQDLVLRLSEQRDLFPQGGDQFSTGLSRALAGGAHLLQRLGRGTGGRGQARGFVLDPGQRIAYTLRGSFSLGTTGAQVIEGRLRLGDVARVDTEAKARDIHGHSFSCMTARASPSMARMLWNRSGQSASGMV